MEQRISIVTLGVTDLQRSREFYERLGWRRSMAKSEGIVFFQAGGMALALFPRQELAKDANIAPEGRGFNGISIAYNTRNRAEVDSVLEDAVAAGASLLKPAQEAFWDPFFPIAEDGSIRISD
jgi:catechol 2,3-dioxygenase-like lactoylglutathione lyase family enzyme